MFSFGPIVLEQVTDGNLKQESFIYKEYSALAGYHPRLNNPMTSRWFGLTSTSLNKHVVKPQVTGNHTL